MVKQSLRIWAGLRRLWLAIFPGRDAVIEIDQHLAQIKNDNGGSWS